MTGQPSANRCIFLGAMLACALAGIAAEAAPTKSAPTDASTRPRLVVLKGDRRLLVASSLGVEEPARHDLKFSVNTDSPKGSMLTCADFSAFVLAQAKPDEYLGDAVGIYTNRELRFGQNVDFEKLQQEAAGKAKRANGP